MTSSTSEKYSSNGAPTYWCTATYAVSRPCAVDSSASSPARKRTSIGNDTGSRRRSTSDSTDDSASTAQSRGSAHSDSTKRTLRSLQNTRWLSSSRVLLPIAAPVSRASVGCDDGNRRPVRCTSSSARLFSSSSVSQVRQAGGGAADSSVRSDVITSARPDHGTA